MSPMLAILHTNMKLGRPVQAKKLSMLYFYTD